MESSFDVIKKDLEKLWNGLDSLQKALIMGLIVIAIVAVSFIVIKSTEPDWGVLYSDLSETDSIAILENLKKGGYPYKLSEDKRTILVPTSLKEELRLMVAENDVIQDSNPGFELLNKMQFGATDFQNKLTRQKIFQDELTRTIEKIRGIQKARVQIAEPDRSVFSDRDEMPSASVMLILESGFKIKIDQIKAIKNLVAYGIPRLSPERVFVTDQNGISLSDDLSKNASGFDDYKTTFEKNTAKKVQKVLARIVGMGNVSVEVSADINFDRTKTTIEKYLPAAGENGNPTGVLTSSNEEKEAYDKGQQKEVSIAEPDEDFFEEEGDSKQLDGEKNTNYEKTKVSKNYNVSKEIKQVVYAPGKIERMTIAVALNRILTTKEKEEIKNLVISASGADTERGDIVTVTGMQFAQNTEEEQVEILNSIKDVSNLEFVVQQIGPLVVVLILGIGTLLIINSILKRPLQGEEVYDSGRVYEEIERSDEENPAGMLETMESIPVIEASLDPELERMKAEINSTIMSDPAEAAKLLQSYIKD